jgi:hypothetical protein
MTSDPSVMLGRHSPQSPGAGVSDAIPVTDEGQSMTEDSSLDPIDVLRGLAHMDVLRDRVRDLHATRVIHRRAAPRNSAEAHAIEHGHVLSHGCCRVAA